jgi:chemotaxis methyl-accepting protein methylase
LDISVVALSRARKRCASLGNVHFRQWDLLRGEVSSVFDLVVAMDVLDYMKRPADLRRAQRKLCRMLAPGGWLLVGTYDQSDVFERVWWRRWLPRGQMIHESFSKIVELRLLSAEATETHSFTLYARTDG